MNYVNGRPRDIVTEAGKRGSKDSYYWLGAKCKPLVFMTREELQELWDSFKTKKRRKASDVQTEDMQTEDMQTEDMQTDDIQTADIQEEDFQTEDI